MKAIAWLAFHVFKNVDAETVASEATLIKGNGTLSYISCSVFEGEQEIFGISGLESDRGQRWFVLWDEEGQTRSYSLQKLKDQAPPAKYFQVRLLTRAELREFKRHRLSGPHEADNPVSLQSVPGSPRHDEVFEVHGLEQQDVDDILDTRRRQYRDNGAVCLEEQHAQMVSAGLDLYLSPLTELDVVRANRGWH